MGIGFMHIVPVHRHDYPDGEATVKTALRWFQERELVENELSDCALGEAGYRLLPEISRIFEDGEPLQRLKIQGLALHYGARKVFHPMEGAEMHFACPACGYEQGWDASDSIGLWYSGEDDFPECPECKQHHHVTEYETRGSRGLEPAWAFSNIGMTIWNGPGSELATWFLDEMRALYGTELRIILSHI
ncbi:hypothetical protein [Paracoccus saliphilus]|uniref:Uncharacterized protein n=1 Tax=Paracoccus saliphilus TaxID=405559 RepID=A0AA45W1R2_9RHOB|nr:hypothetical protein [Paracoccus saliphilus]WCR03749.1 hypothetical protein JHX88_02985 [Paracoccus saliphilus]SIS58963.1 hypothetical protein SAMN05421772_101673 [Paracoccus saliphilus]